MKYLFIVLSSLMFTVFAPVSEAQAPPVQKQQPISKKGPYVPWTKGGSIANACDGRGPTCFDNETLCRAGDATACAARQAEEEALAKKNGKKKK